MRYLLSIPIMVLLLLAGSTTHSSVERGDYVAADTDTVINGVPLRVDTVRDGHGVFILYYDLEGRQVWPDEARVDTLWLPGGALLATPGFRVITQMVGPRYATVTTLLQDTVWNATDGTTLQLPVRCIGGDVGSVYTCRTYFTLDDASGTLYLWARVHNFVYASKIAISINGGGFTSLTNSNISCRQNDRNITAHIPCASVPHDVLDFWTLVTGLSAGVNYIDWKFQKSNDTYANASHGFTVVDFDIMPSTANTTTFRAGDGRVTTTRTYEVYATDPNYAQGAGNTSNGLTLFTTQTGGQRACVDCHMKNAFDQNYWKFPNAGIRDTGLQRGLSETQIADLIAYIRSQAALITESDGTPIEPPGEVWYPVYQPGPVLVSTCGSPDTCDQIYWPTGAGIDAVAEKDWDTFSDVFPNGYQWNDFDHTKQLNMRVIPVAIQYQTWHRWLPTHGHPRDLLGSQFDVLNWSSYLNDVWTQAASGSASAFATAINRVAANVVVPCRMGTGCAQGALGAQAFQNALLSVHQWQISQLWGAHTRYHRTEAAEGSAAGYRRPETRSWQGQTRAIFDMAPHILNTTGAEITPYIYGVGPTWGPSIDKYFSHAWYHLQMTVNAGQGSECGNGTMDWGYQFSHTLGYSDKLGKAASLRMYVSFVKELQNRYYRLDHPCGMTINRTSPFVWAELAGMNNKWKALTANASKNDVKQMITILNRVWLKIRHLYTTGQYPRSATDFQKWNVAGAVPVPWDGKGNPFVNTLDPNQTQMYRALQVSNQIGVTPCVLDSLEQFGLDMQWANPGGGYPNWGAFATCTAPPSNMAPTFTSAMPDTTVDADVEWERQYAATDNESDPFSFSGINLPSGCNVTSGGLLTCTLLQGTYTVTVRVADAGGGTNTSANVTVGSPTVERSYSMANMRFVDFTGGGYVEIDSVVAKGAGAAWGATDSGVLAADALLSDTLITYGIAAVDDDSPYVTAAMSLRSGVTGNDKWCSVTYTKSQRARLVCRPLPGKPVVYVKSASQKIDLPACFSVRYVSNNVSAWGYKHCTGESVDSVGLGGYTLAGLDTLAFSLWSRTDTLAGMRVIDAKSR